MPYKEPNANQKREAMYHAQEKKEKKINNQNVRGSLNI